MRAQQASLTILLTLFFLINPAAQAQDAASTAAPANQNFMIRYGSSPWNTNSKQIDAAFMFMRDKSSGKVAKILFSNLYK